MSACLICFCHAPLPVLQLATSQLAYAKKQEAWLSDRFIIYAEEQVGASQAYHTVPWGHAPTAGSLH